MNLKDPSPRFVSSHRIKDDVAARVFHGVIAHELGDVVHAALHNGPRVLTRAMAGDLT